MVKNILQICLYLALIGCPGFLSAQSLQLADSLYKKGEEFDNRGKLREAEIYYGKAYNIYRQFQDTTSWLKAGKEYASALVYRSKYDDAMELYRMLLEIEHPANDVYNRGDMYNSMGLATRREGDSNQALKYYEKSLSLAKESGDSELIGVVYDNIGLIYTEKGNYSHGLELRKKALEYFQELGNQKRIAITLNNIGYIYLRLNLNDKALEYFNRSLEIRLNLDNVEMLGNIYSSLSRVQYRLGNYSQSLISHQKCLEYREQAGDLYGRARTLHNLALLYEKLGDEDKALEYYRLSLDLSKKVMGPASVAATMRAIAKIMMQRGEREQASELFRQAIDLREKQGNPYLIVSSYYDMLSIEVADGNYAAAEVITDKLENIADTTGNINLYRNIGVWRGDIALGRNDPDQAITNYRKAYKYSLMLPPRLQVQPLKKLARAFHRTGSDSSLVFGELAVNIVEEQRSRAGTVPAHRSGYFKRQSGFYIDMASWLLTYREDYAEAFRMVELAKARTMNDELAEAALNLERHLPENVRIEQSSKKNRIDELYTKLEQVKDSLDQQRVREQILSAELEFAAFQNQISSEFPQYSLSESPGAISLEQARKLIDKNTAVLEYAVSGNTLIMFLITRDLVRTEQVQLNSNVSDSLEIELSLHVNNFRDSILNQAPVPVLDKNSEPLYRMLIEPFSKEISQYENLIIVPDGILAYLPFEALRNKDRYLVQKNRIKYELSLTGLDLLHKSDDSPRRELLAVAGSEFVIKDSETARRSSLSALPSTLVEVDSIAQHFRDVSILKQEEASEQQIKHLLQNNSYRIIHLASHGVINDKNPSRSGLRLSAGGESASPSEDGLLRSSEIYGLNLASDMVVLSACNTALGKIVKGEGMLGLQRSFFYAGASTVVVSLWNIYDRSTAEFMNIFYKSLLMEQDENGQEVSKQGWWEKLLRWTGWEVSIPFGSRATAMHKAKLQMIKHPSFSHPVYWAPFVVVGR